MEKYEPKIRLPGKIIPFPHTKDPHYHFSRLIEEAEEIYNEATADWEIMAEFHGDKSNHPFKGLINNPN